MSASVDVTTSEHNDILGVPFAAVVMRGYDMDSLQTARDNEGSSDTGVSEVQAAENDEVVEGRNISRIDGLSHLATSMGLFGTVLGIATAFFSRGTELALSAPEVLASGMATALFTTVAGLSIFLLGQAFLLVFAWWREAAQRRRLTRSGEAT